MFVRKGKWPVSWRADNNLAESRHEAKSENSKFSKMSASRELMVSLWTNQRAPYDAYESDSF